MTAAGGDTPALREGSGDVVHRIVGLGCRAPSVHNTQPWRWRADGYRIELRADRGRQLDVSDPSGRNLTISCGAALHHVQVAAAGLGRAASVARFPDAADPDLLAAVELGEPTTTTPEDEELLGALQRRLTDRRRFTSWPVPDERLDHLASVAARWGARVFPLTGSSARATAERLVDRAIEAQRRDPRFIAEQEHWIERTPEDGLPASALPAHRHAGERRDRFDRGFAPALTRRPVESSDGVLAICTSRDDPPAWLDAGETLSVLWLRATIAGFSVVPLSQVIEVDETRLALRREVFYDMAHPQLLVRIGWQEISRPSLPPTPRRPLEDVLDSTEARSADER